jgi:co-chaperonin GroES (HSP10)
VDNIRMHQDNVAIRLEPLEQVSAGGLHLPQTRQEKTRKAVVLAVGPGHHNRSGHFVPTQVKAGDRVIVDAFAGQDYSMDLNAPRHNKPTEWGDERGEFRIIREDEIQAVIEDDARAAE